MIPPEPYEGMNKDINVAGCIVVVVIVFLMVGFAFSGFIDNIDKKFMRDKDVPKKEETVKTPHSINME